MQVIFDQSCRLATDQVPGGADRGQRWIACGAERKVAEPDHGEAVRYGDLQTLAGEESAEGYVIVRASDAIGIGVEAQGLRQ